jgi:Resolvase, N terminal domain
MQNKTMDAYIRVSRVAGRDKKNGGDSFHSPEEQEDGIRRWAASNCATIAEVITELDVSGGKRAAERELERLV